MQIFDYHNRKCIHAPYHLLEQQTVKQDYIKPKLEILGAVEAITHNAYEKNSDTQGGPDGTAFPPGS